ncbi:hypothetical protein EV356DRAFT_166335 [Viridothelium virens]|uniref:Uncharacterized protein n=1 Tax=Viridothelium virens TaxID=1048519 RepID=A0A6A6HMG9_VIRVR|nr:hypothetical protein EV356DRAFT_166335 [Viridothelium virens]
MSTKTLAPPPACTPSSPSSLSSRPPSRSRPKHSKKKSDPFLELNTTPGNSPSPPNSPETSHETGPSDPSESFFTQLILSPLLFTSFLLSLFLVDRRNRAYRVSEHPTTSTVASVLSRIAPAKWWDPEPYGTHNGGNDGSGDRPKQPWYIKKKHRKIAKMEVSEAFELRTSVIFGIVVTMMTVLIGAALGMKKIYDWAWVG